MLTVTPPPPVAALEEAPPAAIVDTMHDAYGQVDLPASPYGVFLAGPSATGDIEGVIIHGAQGARSLTVLLLAPASSEKTGRERERREEDANDCDRDDAQRHDCR